MGKGDSLLDLKSLTPDYIQPPKHTATFV